MTDHTHPAARAGTYALGTRTVQRMGYGAMQLAGPGVFGPPRDLAAAHAVLHEALNLGINHIDTSDFYGPHVTNRILREALHPYSDDLVIVTKVGARRPEDGSWVPAMSGPELIAAVHDNLRHLGLEALDVVNLRMMGGGEAHGPVEESVAEPLSVLAELQAQGLIRHLGLSNVTPTQFEEAQTIAPIVCVQNMYNLAHRDDDAFIDDLARQGTAYVPFFPLGGFSPLQSDILEVVAARLGATPNTVALAWLLQRSPNILLIPGTSSPDERRGRRADASSRRTGAARHRLCPSGLTVPEWRGSRQAPGHPAARQGSNKSCAVSGRVALCGWVSGRRRLTRCPAAIASCSERTPDVTPGRGAFSPGGAGARRPTSRHRSSRCGR